jgi:hypothetical protein
MKGDLPRHLLVILACLAGIIGMGIVFGGLMHGDGYQVARGAPFLLLGGWMAARDLARSMLKHQTRSRASGESRLKIGRAPDPAGGSRPVR